MAPVILILLFTFSALLTFALCRQAFPLGQFLGVMDVPSGAGGYKQHAAPTPAVGGVIVAIVAAICSLAILPLTIHIAEERLKVRLIAFAAIYAAMIVGFIDDRRNLGAPTRLALGIALATVLLLLVPQYQVRRVYFVSIGYAQDTGIWALPFTVVCLLALKNAINMADGRNGLVIGLAIIWNVFFLFHATPAILPGLLCTLAALLALFAFNWRGKLFLGDCGSYGLATYFGVLALALHKDSFGTVATAEVVLLFLIPLLDTSRLIVSRLAGGRSPLSPDRCHLHHLLDDAIGWRRAWAVYMLMTIIPLVLYQLTYGYGVYIIGATAAGYAVVVLGCTGAAKPDPLSGSADAGK
jgi:UDP-GlcNAc:undecaprenyl-phosphate GlcNAc-1-phosphate transferase